MIDIKEGVELAETIGKIGKVADFEELTHKNIKTITNAISIVNDFNSKINSYGKHIFDSMYLDTVEGWMGKLADKDIKKIFGKSPKVGNRHTRYVLCYQTMTIFKYDDSRSGWCMGSRSCTNTKYSFIQTKTKDGQIEQKLVITNTWKTQTARFDHIPWINRERNITINLSKRSVVVSGDNISDGY